MNKLNNCNCQPHFDVRCKCSPNSVGFAVCPEKVNTAIWYLENDGLTEDEGWEDMIEAILQEEYINIRKYSDKDIKDIIDGIKENKLDDDSDYETESSISSEEFITEGELDDFLLHRDEDEKNILENEKVKPEKDDDGYFSLKDCDYKINKHNLVEK